MPVINHLWNIAFMCHLNILLMTNIANIPYLGNLDHTVKANPFQFIKTEGATFFISIVNWPEYPQCPDVIVYAGYTDEMLWLNFCVKNDYMRTHAIHDQDPVYEDTCVEFFIGTSESYRNFEFNCLGVCLSATGPDRYSRTRLSDSELSRIVRIPSLSRENLPKEGELCDWELTVGIPLSILKIQTGSIFYGNFYKCGNKTKISHYLSWAPIDTEKPNFHCPNFFHAIQLVNNSGCKR
jgi:hypothetical protein